MAAGVVDRVWEVEDPVALLDAESVSLPKAAEEMNMSTDWNAAFESYRKEAESSLARGGSYTESTRQNIERAIANSERLAPNDPAARAFRDGLRSLLPALTNIYKAPDSN